MLIAIDSSTIEKVDKKKESKKDLNTSNEFPEFVSNSADPQKKKGDSELEPEVDQEAWEREDHRRTAEIAEKVSKKYHFTDPEPYWVGPINRPYTISEIFPYGGIASIKFICTCRKEVIIQDIDIPIPNKVEDENEEEELNEKIGRSTYYRCDCGTIYTVNVNVVKETSEICIIPETISEIFYRIDFSSFAPEATQDNFQKLSKQVNMLERRLNALISAFRSHESR